MISAKKSGKTIVVNSWNKNCTTCKKQTKIFKEAQKDFKNVIFFYYEQTKNKDIAEFLKIDYWTTIVIYKDSKEIARSIGSTNKNEIYELIKKGI